MKFITLILGICIAAQSSFAGASAEKVSLWAKGTMPQNTESAQKALAYEKEKAEILKNNKNAKDVRGKPLRSFFVEEAYYVLSLPEGGKKTGLVVVCPGGGYVGLAANHEGKQIVDWLNKNGIAAMMLMYRVPHNPQGALQDIRRAIRIARANAQKWNIDPNKIAVMGFSAGANLSARASVSPESDYAPIDELDKLSAKPNATVLIYPAYCDTRGHNIRWKIPNGGKRDYNNLYALAPNLKITKDAPPTFIAQSQDDRSYINAAFAYYLALKEANVPSCLHIFDKGGHGYGLSTNRKTKDGGKFLPSAWGGLAIDWLRSHGF